MALNPLRIFFKCFYILISYQFRKVEMENTNQDLLLTDVSEMGGIHYVK